MYQQNNFNFTNFNFNHRHLRQHNHHHYRQLPPLWTMQPPPLQTTTTPTATAATTTTTIITGFETYLRLEPWYFLFLPFFFVFNFYILHLDYMYGAETTTMTRPPPENGPKRLKNVVWAFGKPFFFLLRL